MRATHCVDGREFPHVRFGGINGRLSLMKPGFRIVFLVAALVHFSGTVRAEPETWTPDKQAQVETEKRNAATLKKRVQSLNRRLRKQKKRGRNRARELEKMTDELAKAKENLAAVQEALEGLNRQREEHELRMETVRRAAKLVDQAEALVTRRQFRAAVERHRRAFDMTRASMRLYSIALIHDRHLKDPKSTKEAYAAFIEAAGTEHPKHVRYARARVGQFKALSLSGSDTTQLQSKDQPTSGGATKTVSWVLVGVGGAATLAGIITAFSASDSEAKFRATDELDKKQRWRRVGENQALAADILIGLGGAAVVTGVVLLTLSSEPESSRSAILAPSLSSESAGLTPTIGF